MMKEMRFGWTHNHLLSKFAVSILFAGLAFYLVYSSSSRFLPIVDDTVTVVSLLPAATPPEIFQVGRQNAQEEKCDIFSGDWIPNLSEPIYTNESCHVIQDHQNCMRNGRPDSGYIYWRWRPSQCELPQFNALRFLDLMRNKSWGFIGDSIMRNHVQSLLCILSQVEDAIVVYHNEEYTSHIWRFPSFNFTLSVIWSPLLVKAAIFEDNNGVTSADIQLHLDELDEKWTSQYHRFDYVVIAGGKWFTKPAIHYENNLVTGCHDCAGKNLTEFAFDYAYRKVLRLVFRFITSSDHHATILFRTFTPDHFENGKWFSGGTCKRVHPFQEGETDLSDIDSMLRDVENEEFVKAAELGSKRGLAIKLLDTTRMSLLRPDGHPGPYRQFQPFAENQNATVQNDCLHWCLPGPIDSWNDLVMQMVGHL